MTRQLHAHPGRVGRLALAIWFGIHSSHLNKRYKRCVPYRNSPVLVLLRTPGSHLRLASTPL